MPAAAIEVKDAVENFATPDEFALIVRASWRHIVDEKKGAVYQD